jgi:hypothetical protein
VSRFRLSRHVIVVATLVAFASACASTPEAKAYQSIATCNAAAQGAVKSFGLIYQVEKAKDPALWADRYNKAEAAYMAYQKIAAAAVDAAASGGETPLVLAAVNEALGQLTGLLASYGVK